MSGDEVISETAAPPVAEEPTPESTRERLVRQFERWVDGMLAGEPPPPGLPEELLVQADVADPDPRDGRDRECDLYTLFAGLTALTGEVRLQGRTFRQLTDALAPLADMPRQLERLAAEREDRDEAPEPGESDEPAVSGKQALEVMLDLYDRLERGLRTCDDGIAALKAPRGGWLRRRLAARTAGRATAAVEAIRDASALTLQRLETALREWGVERVGRAGEKFDPLRMTAVQVRPAPGVEPGTVLEVNRAGYAVRGLLKATAQVTVARAGSVNGQTQGDR